MKLWKKVCVLAGVTALAGAGWAQAAAAPDPAKEIATLEAKLNDWPQLGRYKADDQKLQGTDSTGRVVFYGDSITDHWPLANSFPGEPYINRGISGQTTPQMVVRFRQDVINLHPAAVIILAGTNDIAGNTGPETPEEIQDNIKSMIDLAKANGIRVVLASILPTTRYPWRPSAGDPAQKIQSMNNWMAGYCVNHGVTYLDYYTALADDNGAMKPGLSKDGVHPTPQGYAVMAPLAQKAINEVLGRH